MFLRTEAPRGDFLSFLDSDNMNRFQMNRIITAFLFRTGGIPDGSVL